MPPVRRTTGFSAADAQDDFLRARRRSAVSHLGRRLRGAGDVDLILPFDEVVAALGRTGERRLGRQVIDVDSVLGTVDRPREFDRQFRPTTPRVRARWERIAQAMRRGEALPPIDVYRVGDVHFVRDGHHRVSVARALGLKKIDANVIEVRTRVGADRALRLADLPLKDHERLFAERVPLPPEARARVRPTDPSAWGRLAEGVEAWGFRAMQDRAELMDREQTARAWYEEEYLPVVEMLTEAGMITDPLRETDVYLRMSEDRYRLLRTHEWSEGVLDRLRDSTPRRRRPDGA